MVELDENQRRAVEHGEGPCLVLAGPGTGKTRVIVERSAGLIETGAARPENLLVLTFSRRAAKEMRERLHDRLRISYSSFFIGTFHSLGLSIVTRHHRWLGYSARPSLLTSEEQWARIARMMRADDAALWISYGGYRGMRSFIQQVFDFILRAQERLLTAEDVTRLAKEHGREDWLEVAAFMQRYQDAVRAENFVDYGGMVEQAARVLRERPDVRSALHEQYTHLLVDEYQDTNPGQDELLALLAGERKNIFVVGDPDQSIYAFRGATVDNILSFAHRYDAETIELGTNYRSAPAIVRATTTLIEHNRMTHASRPLEPGAQRRADVIAQRFDHASEEIEFVAREARRLHVENGVPFSEIAVLVRSIRRVGAELDGVLSRHEVPHRILGGSIRLYDHPYVRPMIGFLRLATGAIDDDHRVAEIGEVLSSVVCDLDPLVLRALQREARLGGTDMLDVLEDPPIPLDGDARDAIDAFLGLLGALQDAAGRTTVDVLVWKIWDTLPAFGALVAMQDRANIAAIREFYHQVVRFTQRHPHDGNLNDFLALSEAGDLGEDPWLTQHDDGADAVKVMTIHQAKGLEFDVVFVPGLVDGAFPNLARPAALFDPEIFAGRSAQTREHFRAHALEEERRVAYVAITRAKTRAYLSAVDDERSALDRPVSRFLKEIEPALTGTRPPRPERAFLGLAEAACAMRRTLAEPDAPVTEKAVALLTLRGMPDADPATWWGALSQTANPLPLFPDGALPILSYSSLSTYENCPQRFLYDRELALERAEGDALGFGTFVHAALEEFLSLPPDDRTRAALFALGEKHFDPAAFRFRAMAHQAHRKMLEILGNFWEREFRPQGRHITEHPFEFAIDGVTIRGKIDRVDVEPDGLVLIDYKTGSGYFTAHEAQRDLQLALYYLAALQDPVLSGLGEPKELAYLYVAQPMKKGLRRVKQEILPDHRAVVERRVRSLIAGMRAEDFAWSPAADCGFCGYRTVCRRHPEGRDVPL